MDWKNVLRSRLERAESKPNLDLSKKIGNSNPGVKKRRLIRQGGFQASHTGEIERGSKKSEVSLVPTSSFKKVSYELCGSRVKGVVGQWFN